MMPHATSQGEPEAIIVRTPNWLGDLVISTAFLQALLARFPQARVDLIVRQGMEVLPLPHRGRVWPFDKRRQRPGRFGRTLRGEGYSHFFVLPPSFSAAWMARASGVPYRIGLAQPGRNWLLNPALPRAHAPRTVHLAREYLTLLAPWLDGTSASATPHLPADADWIAHHWPAGLAGDHPYVVLAPGAEYGPAKQWPVGHYQVVARGLARAGWRVVVSGLPQDQEAGDHIIQGLPDALNLAGTTHLAQATAVLARAALVVSNDSGAMHLAAALHRPQVALFGSTNPRWTGPLNPQAEVLSRNEPCAPCYARTCPLGHRRCLDAMAPEPVLARALHLLARVDHAAGAEGAPVPGAGDRAPA